jgi:uncharacterized protein YkwD
MSFRRLLVGTSAALLLGTMVPHTSTAAGGNCWSFKGAEKKFAQRMNRARRAAGVGRFSLDRELSRVARAHSRAMARKRDTFHKFGRTKRRVTNWTALGENVGAGGSVSSLHGAFMASAGHRQNIQNRRFKHVGVGVRKAHGRLWVTVVFQSKANPGTTMSMPSC